MSPPQRLTGQLTPRQVDILKHLAAGLNAAETGEALGVTARSVAGHLYRIYGLIGATNAAHAVAIAYETGVLVTSVEQKRRAERTRQAAIHGRECAMWRPNRCDCDASRRPPHIPGQLALPAR